MALDIMQTLVQFLCPTYSAQSACNAFISQPSHQVMEPMGPMLYFLFFPMVFLILFIYVGSRAIFSGHKGINLLIGVAVLAFIIIQGWYPVILWVGEFWFAILPLLFIFYLITRRHANGGGGGMSGVGKGGGMSGFGGLKNLLEKGRKVTRMGKDEKREIMDAIGDVDTAIHLTKDIKSGKSDRPGPDSQEVRGIKTSARAILSKYEANPFREMGGELETLRDKIKELDKISSGV